MKQVFVTGAPGWLGNRLVKGLIVGLEDYPRLPKAKKIRCLVLPGLEAAFLEQFPNVEIIYGDVRKKETLKGKMKDCKLVIHCVGIIHPKKIKDFYCINTEGTKNVLEEAIKSKVKRFVFVSSNSAAGVNVSRNKLMKEEDPCRPYKHYGKSKLLAEQLVNKAHRQGKIETVIVRGCWFYGVNQPPRQTEFFQMIKKGKPPLFGDGRNLRSMSYVDNMVQGLILAATNPKAKGQIYWIADEKPYETSEIYKVIAELLGVKKLKFLKIPSPACKIFELADDILQALGLYISKIHVAGEMNKNIACSIEKAKKELGYCPKISLREGMRRSIKWCQDHGQEI